MKLRYIIVTSFLILFLIGAEPSRPTQTPQIPAEQHTNSGTKAESETNKQKEASQNLSFIINAAKPKDTEKHSNWNSNKTDQEATDFWPIFGYHLKTDTLIVIFAGIQAVATIFLVVSTYKLWKSTEKMWESTERSSNLVHKGFIATNRPRLRVRYIHSDSFVFKETGNLPPLVGVYIANIGGSDATDIKCNAVFNLRRGNIWTAPGIENLPHSPCHGPSLLAPGEQGRYEPRTWFKFSSGDDDEIKKGIKTFLIIGTVRYHDANQTKRETGFGWAYDPDTGEFSKREKEAQYNYED